MILVHLTNDDYDQDQGKSCLVNTYCLGNEETKSLPITKDLHLLTFTGFTQDDRDEEV